MSLLWTLEVLSLVCSCWTGIKANLRGSRQNYADFHTAFLKLFLLCKLFPTSHKHAHTLPNLQVCFYRIITHFCLCSNTLSSLQDSSTELLPVISTCTLQVSALSLPNQFKNSLIQNKSTCCLESTSAPRERTGMLSLPSQVLPPHQGTSALQGWLCYSGCSPLCNWDVMEKNAFSRFIKSLNCSWEQSSTGLPAAIKGNAPSTVTREENPRFPSSLSQCNKSRVT